MGDGYKQETDSTLLLPNEGEIRRGENLSAVNFRADPGAMPDSCEGGMFLLQAGGLKALGDCVGAGGPGWPDFWLGYVLQFEDLGRAGATWRRAMDHFSATGDTDGVGLAACGLVQGALLDWQRRRDFEDMAGHVTALTRAAADDDTPLNLFVSTARLLLAADSRVPAHAVAADLDRAFGVLASPQPAMLPAALRLATAALPVLGQALDAVRADDFFQAGGAWARDPRCGAYNQALWHLAVVDMRFFDPGWTSRLLEALQAAASLAAQASAPWLVAHTHLLRAAIVLSDGDVTAAQRELQAAHPLLTPDRNAQYWLYHLYRSRLALQCDDTQAALDHLLEGQRLQQEAGLKPERRTAFDMQLAHVRAARGDLVIAADLYARAAEVSVGSQRIPCDAHHHLVRGLAAWRDGAEAAAREHIDVGLAQASSIGLTHVFRALPAIAAEVCDAAFVLQVQTAFAGRIVSARQLACPDPANGQWPWPIRIRALGGFVVERDGAPMRYGRKSPKRVLELLQFVVARGGGRVDADQAATALWPDADGDEAHASLKTLVHRVRQTFGGDWLQVREGMLCLDEEKVWLDTLALERLAERIDAPPVAGAGHALFDRRCEQLLAIYRGPLFGEAEMPPWAESQRQRLHRQWLRAVLTLAGRMEACGQGDAARGLLSRALDRDPAAEELHQRLIHSHVVRGDAAQALRAFDHCRAALRGLLGVEPSAHTRELLAGLAIRSS